MATYLLPNRVIGLVVMQGVVIAAGKGLRLRPLTDKIPKCMVDIKGKPLLEHILERLVKVGVDEVHVVVGYMREVIEDHFGPEFEGVKINYFVQPEPKGTAHALSLVEKYVNGRFIVTNSDVLTETHNYLVLTSSQEVEDADAIILARQVHDPWRFGVLKTQGNVVLDIVEKPLPGEEPSRLVNAGIYGFDKDFFSAVKKTPLSVRGEYEIVDSLRKYMASGNKVGYREITGACIDIEHTHDVEEANKLKDEEFPS